VKPLSVATSIKYPVALVEAAQVTTTLLPVAVVLPLRTGGFGTVSTLVMFEFTGVVPELSTTRTK